MYVLLLAFQCARQASKCNWMLRMHALPPCAHRHVCRSSHPSACLIPDILPSHAVMYAQVITSYEEGKARGHERTHHDSAKHEQQELGTASADFTSSTAELMSAKKA
jgi:hypothetical protein